MATKTTRAKKNPVSNEMVKEPAVAYAPTREKTRRKQLIEKTAQRKLTNQEFSELVEILDTGLTIEEIAKINNIPESTYNQLLKLPIEDGRFVYFDKDSFEYEQDDEYLDDYEEDDNYLIIDLTSDNGSITSEWSGVL